jgi:hypothetical protein
MAGEKNRRLKAEISTGFSICLSQLRKINRNGYNAIFYMRGKAMYLVEVNALLATIGYGVILLGLIFWKLEDCCFSMSECEMGKSFLKKVAWLCFVAGFVLQILAIWVH